MYNFNCDNVHFSVFGYEDGRLVMDQVLARFKRFE